MERIITYHITASEAGLRIEQYLRRLGYSYQNITQLKKMRESILVNGVWSYMRTPLSAGDHLTVHINETESSQNIPPVRLPLSIVYEDEDILVVNKPAKMPVHPSLNNYRNSLANALMWYYQEKGQPFIFRCTNRLDRDTSGLTVIAKHLVSSSILSGMGARHEIEREYLAVACGSVTPDEGTITAPLARAGTSLIERKVDFQHGEHAVTHYKVLEVKNGYSLVSLLLETGRTHQIRVHMKYIGFPLAGDYLYHPDSISPAGNQSVCAPGTAHSAHTVPNACAAHGAYTASGKGCIDRQALHSHRLKFRHPITGEMLEFTAPMPEDMQNILA